MTPSYKNKFDSAVRRKDDNRKLKDRLLMLEQGKVSKSKKETENEDMIFHLKNKIESLNKIRKAKMNKYKVSIKHVYKKVEAVEDEVLQNKLKLDELSKDNNNQGKSVSKLKNMVGLKVNRSIGFIQTREDLMN